MKNRIESEAVLLANRRYLVAMTGHTVGDHWQIRLFVDGNQIAEGITAQFPASSVVPDSPILGAELFCLPSSYYRGLSGQTLALILASDSNDIEYLTRR